MLAFKSLPGHIPQMIINRLSRQTESHCYGAHNPARRELQEASYALDRITDGRRKPGRRARIGKACAQLQKKFMVLSKTSERLAAAKNVASVKCFTEKGFRESPSSSPKKAKTFTRLKLRRSAGMSRTSLHPS